MEHEPCAAGVRGGCAIVPVMFALSNQTWWWTALPAAH
ncbi:trp operon leader peptide [Streptomyces lushanensis]